MHTYRTVAAAILLTIVSVGPLFAQERVDALLAQARRAIGVDETTPIVRVSIDVRVRRGLDTRNTPISSEIQLRFVLPDKYLRIETVSIGRFSRTSSIGVNGGELMFEDGGVAAEMGADPRAPGPQREEAIANLRRELFRLLTVWLLSPPADARPTFVNAGAAEARGGRTDVVDVRGEEGRNLRLYIDAASHRLLRATYDLEIVDPEQARALRGRMTSAVRRDGSAVTVEKLRLQAARLREEMRKLPRKTVTAEMRFSRQRPFGAVTLPEVMVVEAGEMKEEWTVLSVKLNPPPDPGFFGG